MSAPLSPAKLRRIEDGLSELVKPSISEIRSLLEEVQVSRATIRRLAEQQLALGSAAERAAQILDDGLKGASK